MPLLEDPEMGFSRRDFAALWIVQAASCPMCFIRGVNSLLIPLMVCVGDHPILLLYMNKKYDFQKGLV